MSKQSRISWNANLQSLPNRDDFLAHLVQLNPSWFLGMNGLKEAWEIQKALPDTNVIHRWKGSVGIDDDDNPRTVTPKVWLDTRISQLHRDGIPTDGLWLYTNNESGDSDEVISWLIDLVKMGVDRGVKLVVGNFSAGTPPGDPIEQWNRPKMLELLRLLNTHRKTNVLGLHEYFMAIIASGFVGGLPTALKTTDGVLIHPDYTNYLNWPNIEDAQNTTMWHCGRMKFINKVCHDHGFAPPRILRTEIGADNLGGEEYDRWRKSLPVAGGFTEIRGMFTLENIYKMWFPNLTFYEAVLLNLAYGEEAIYEPLENDEGGLLFTMTGDVGWNSHGFNYKDHPGFWSMLEHYAETRFVRGRSWAVVNPPAPTPSPVEIPPDSEKDLYTFVRSESPSNVRYGPDVSYDGVGQIKYNDVIYVYPGTVRFDPMKRYKWVYVSKYDESVRGWVALITPFETMFSKVPPQAPGDYITFSLELPTSYESVLSFLSEVILTLKDLIP